MEQNNNIPQGYKDSSLGVIPKEWEVKRLGDLVKITSGESPSLFNLSNTGRYPYVKVEDMNNCEKIQVYSREYSNDEKSLIPKWSVIFPKRGAAILNNKVRIAGADIQMDSNMMAITPFENSIVGEYLYYQIICEQLFKIADTSTIPQINNKHIIPYKIPLPPLPEQQKIAEILSVWDEAIEKQTQLIAQFETRKRGLMQQLLTGKKRVKGFRGKWEKYHLGSLGDTYIGLTGKNKDDFGKGKPYIPYLNIFNNSKIDTTFFDYVDVKADESQNKVQYGDIFFTVSSETPNEVGMASVLLENVDELYLNSFCFGFRLYDFNTLLPEFGSYYLRSDVFRSEIYKLSQGATRFNLSKNSLMKLDILLPSLAEQTAIANILSAADTEIAFAKQKLARLKEQKKGLMQVLLTGKKRVKI